jgi:hypothetical protein
MAPIAHGKFLKRSFLILVAFSQLGASWAAPKGSDQPMQESQVAHIVSSIESSNTLTLEEGKTIQLLGIRENRSPETLDFLNGLVRGKPVLIEEIRTSSTGAFYCVYAIDIHVQDIMQILKPSYPDIRGYTNLRVSNQTMKGLAYSINVLLLKLGYAEVEESADFENLGYFRACEIEAKEHSRGLWKGSSGPNAIR